MSREAKQGASAKSILIMIGIYDTVVYLSHVLLLPARPQLQCTENSNHMVQEKFLSTGCQSPCLQARDHCTTLLPGTPGRSST